MTPKGCKETSAIFLPRALPEASCGVQLHDSY
jgi:hypothetical protein